MKTLVEQLEKVLKTESQVYDQLLALSEEMREAILQKDLPRITSITNKHDACAHSIEEWEENRLRICDQLAKELLKKEQHLTLSSLLKTLPLSQTDQLRTLRDDLKKKIHSVVRKNST